MKRIQLIALLVPIIISFTIVLMFAAQTVFAGAFYSDQKVVVVFDGAAISQADQGLELTKSFNGLLASLVGDEQVIFVVAGTVPEIMEPVSATAPEFKSKLETLENKLAFAAASDEYTLATTAAEVHTYLAQMRVAPGSIIYFVTGDSTGVDLLRVTDQLMTVISRFEKSEWIVNTVVMPGSSTAAADRLASMSVRTGGRLYQLSGTSSFKLLADDLLLDQSKGSLATIGDRVLAKEDIRTSVISISPGTSEITLLFLKETPFGSLRLSNPKGMEVSTGDRASSWVLETPYAVIWRLMDPIAGDWKVDATGIEGLLSPWTYAINKYNLVLDGSTTLPLGEITSLVAHVAEGKSVAVINNARLFANITLPSGNTMVVEMKDNGFEGDGVAGDGYYAVMLPPLKESGQYTVQLELDWVHSNQQITTQTYFQAKDFPSLNIVAEKIEGLKLGERVKVATVRVNVAGSPYMVTPDKIKASITAQNGAVEILEVLPHRLYGNGPASDYDIYYTPQADGLNTLGLQLTMDYSGTSYSRMYSPIVISVDALSPVAPIVKPPVEAPVVAPVVVTPLAPVVDSQETSFPFKALIPVFVVIALAVLVGIYTITRTKPFGFLYNDRNEPLVDFTAIRRSIIARLFSRDSISGDELKVPGLEGIAFKFKGSNVTILSKHASQTVRVNNQPLVGQADIRHRSWIGSKGRLYSFLLAPPSSQPAGQGAGDD